MLSEVIPSSTLKDSSIDLDLNKLMDDLQTKHTNHKKEKHVDQKGMIMIEWENDVPQNLNTTHIYSIYPEDDVYGVYDCVARKGAGINYIISKRQWIKNILFYVWILDCTCGHSATKNSKSLIPRQYINARDPKITHNDPNYYKKKGI